MQRIFWPAKPHTVTKASCGLCVAHVHSFGAKRQLRVMELFSEKTRLVAMLAGELMCNSVKLLLCVPRKSTLCAANLTVWAVCLIHMGVKSDINFQKF